MKASEIIQSLQESIITKCNNHIVKATNNINQEIDNLFDNECILSTNDSSEGLSILIPITGCKMKCPYCFNSHLWNQKTKPEFIKKDLEKFIDGISIFVFGGNNPIGDNFWVTQEIINNIREIKKSYIELQIATLSDLDLNKIESIQPDKVSITINCMKNKWIDNIQKLNCDYEIRQIYINDELTKNPPIDVDVVQQIQTEKCYDEEYRKLSQPNRHEVYNYAKSINASSIFTSENGYEKI